MLIFLLTNDSTSVDTVQTYEIPEIVSYTDGISIVREVMPRYYEQSIADMLENLPGTMISYGFMDMNGIRFRGAHPYYTRIYLNGRQQRDDLMGYLNLAQLSLNSIEKATYGPGMAGNTVSSLNLESKVNRYDRPYSYANFRFGSFGTNIYGMELTRAITNDLGLTMTGEFHKTDGYRDNTDADRLSIYANIYYNHFFPARLDLFYSEHNYGFPGTVDQSLGGRQKDKFFDISTTASQQQSFVNFFYSARNIEYVDSLNFETIEDRLKQTGAEVSYHRDIFGAGVDYGLAGYFVIADGTLRYFMDFPLDIWARVSKTFDRLSFQATGYFGKAGDHRIFLLPKFETGYNFYKSMQFYLSLWGDARAPSDIELEAMFDTLNPYFRVAGNSDLVPEYCWGQEVGVRGDRYAVSFYRFDYDNFITVSVDSADYYQYANIDTWLITGCDASFDFPLRFYGNDSNRIVSLVLGGSGNLIFDGDSVPFTPQYQLGGRLSLTRELGRFGFGVATSAVVYGRRIDLSGQEFSGFIVCSVAGLVKFLGLAVVARVNNLFNEDYAYIPQYPMPLRNYDVSVKWEFWD